MDAPPSFTFAKETVTQLITLATALIGVSITFTKDIRNGAAKFDRKWLFRSWIAFLVSVVGGIWTLMALTGALSKDVVPHDPYGSNIAIPYFLQIVTFLLGIGMLIRHASK